ncbi:MAG: ABC transporter permease subunit [Pseudonocardiaceae bacterium]|nr:ABC transporter permease subunit [Pseudonocardiaceae bacterium]
MEATVDEQPPVAEPSARRRARRDLVRALLRSKTFMVGCAILLWWVLDSVAWSLFVPTDPQALDPTNALAAPSAQHWLGTDNLGRDVLSRVLAGATTVLGIAPAATLLALLLGTTIGLAAGYYRGWFDELITRLLDAFLAFPPIVVAVLALAVVGASNVAVILVTGLLFVPNVARTVRSVVLQERSRDYIAAARLRGERGPYIMVAEILPNVGGPLMVEATVRFGYAVFTVATLSFLGLGLQQPSPDWGLAISLGRSYLQVAPWVVLAPALALATLVVSINLVVDGLRQVIEE